MLPLRLGGSDVYYEGYERHARALLLTLTIKFHKPFIIRTRALSIVTVEARQTHNPLTTHLAAQHREEAQDGI